MTGARPTVVVCGLGPGAEADLTDGTRALLGGSDPIFLRTTRHPTAALATEFTSFDEIYDDATHLDEVYLTISERLAEAASEHGRVVYAVPGSPLVLERSVAHLRARPDIEVELHPAVSFLDAAWARLGVDPVEAGVRLVDGHTFATDAAGERGPLLVAHAHAEWVLSDIKLAVDAGPEMTAVVLQALGTPHERIVEVPWPELDRSVEPDHLTSLFLPVVAAPVAGELQRTVELMHRLRQDCPWDRKQDHQSLRRYLVEETYEVIDALDELADGGDDAYISLEEELGDVWFQLLFHAELANEAGQFNIADVARTVHDKLVSRHPHVFGDVDAADAETVVANWENIKRDEKGRQSIMDGIPRHLPALTLAEKILKKANRAGVEADPGELDRVLDGIDDRITADELGSLLFTVVERARQLGLDPEASLRAAANDAERVFRLSEASGSKPRSWVTG